MLQVYTACKHVWRYQSTCTILRQLEVECLNIKITRSVLNAILKIIFYEKPIPLFNCFVSLNRRTSNYFIPRINKNINKKLSFAYYGPFFWSLIPSPVKINLELSSSKLTNTELLNLYISYIDQYYYLFFCFRSYRCYTMSMIYNIFSH